MSAVISNRRRSDRRLSSALLGGVVGPPLFVAVFLVDGFIHPAYNSVTDFVSELSRGELGWLQVVNFLVFAGMMLMFAAGIRWGAPVGPGSVAGSALFAIIGVSLVLCGLFVTDPHTAKVQTVQGMIHIFAAMPVFGGMALACSIFARRFQGFLRWYSLASGALVLVSWVAIFPVGYPFGIIGIMQRVAILIGLTWITVLAVALCAERAGEIRAYRTAPRQPCPARRYACRTSDPGRIDAMSHVSAHHPA